MIVPHITIEQVRAMYSHCDEQSYPFFLEAENSLIDAYNKKQASEQPLISAEDARKLGAGNAEWCMRSGGNWSVISSTHSWFDGVQYRAIKQPEPVEPHAELKAMYAQKLMKFDPAKGTLYPYPQEPSKYRAWHGKDAWLFNPYTGTKRDSRDIGSDPFGTLIFDVIPPTLNTEQPTCQVKDLDTGELKTMTREAAKLLQAELGDTVEWRLSGVGYVSNSGLNFDMGSVYSYKLRGTVKLTIDDEPAKMLTPAQCEAERLVRIDTHDVEVLTDTHKSWELADNEFLSAFEYRLIRKQPSWTGSREDVIALLNELGVTK